MKKYEFTLNIYEIIEAESQEEAWRIAKDRVVSGFYGPTQANLEFLEELPELGEEESAGS